MHNSDTKHEKGLPIAAQGQQVATTRKYTPDNNGCHSVDIAHIPDNTSCFSNHFVLIKFGVGCFSQEKHFRGEFMKIIEADEMAPVIVSIFFRIL